MNPTEAIDDVLMHYGKKGMKWGVRSRSKAGGGEGKSKKLKAPKEYSEDAAKAKELHARAKKKGAQSLSNKEMQDLLTRLELAGRYTQANAKTKSRGQKFAEDLARDIGRDLTKELGKSVSKGISNKARASGKAFNDKMLANALKDMPMSVMWGEG